MKIKVVSVLVILLFLAGCTFLQEKTNSSFKIQYQTQQVKIFNFNRTDYGTEAHFKADIIIPQNGTKLFLNLTWDASAEHLNFGNSSIMRTHNFTYQIEIIPPDKTVCNPGNNISNGTDLVKRTGHIKLICLLNKLPDNRTLETHSRSNAEKSQVIGYNGAGKWTLNMSLSFRTSDFPPVPWTNWTLTTELEQYHYVVDTIK